MYKDRFPVLVKNNVPSKDGLTRNLMNLLPQLQQYCQYLSQNKWDGEDIAQEVMVKVLDRYKHKEDITPALLKRIAYNFWIDTIRKRKNETSLSLTELEETTKETSDALDVIDFLMKKLTPKQAVIVMLKEGFQFKSKEIARLLGTTEMAVKASLSRARKRMDSKDIEKAPFSNQLYWTEEEHDQLYQLFYKAITLQDPTVLIEAIPSIRTLKKETGAPTAILNQRLHYSPSSTLSMAA
ncbi:sigma-70 family RNA polymerase sigma factor [Bacillus norwichensis]|uniref:Sigma-70 family RNA polymerase sigma factor n=1 Tax=Bacillus norwichensis TaxID=2762217 RepID=A0ABR8VJL7_9BACI|nr:sigma-70 family RNA polymerase sigma factor [Bacillus norwichensis]MBD8004965.1 sigma-70 family RNA polymerase sigma factor [Bacillus norwichensis]